MSITVELFVKGIWYLVGYFVVVTLGTLFVSFILSKLKVEDEQKYPKGIEGAGRLIGIMERVLVITLIYLDEPTAIGIVFAAKSIVRFGSIKERAFAEYYLIGSMVSITFALLTGILCSFMVSNIG